MEGNELLVGVTEDGEIGINFAEVMNGWGHLTFSPEQAKHLGWTLLRQAAIAAQEVDQDYPWRTPTPGTVRIMQERERQIAQEGWTAANDAQYPDGVLAQAGACYALVRGDAEMPLIWPFSRMWWKPSTDPIRNLEKAGAMIAAEIDRLQDAENKRKQAEQQEIPDNDDAPVG